LWFKGERIFVLSKETNVGSLSYPWLGKPVKDYRGEDTNVKKWGEFFYSYEVLTISFPKF
jgi:hypothetical protein